MAGSARGSVGLGRAGRVGEGESDSAGAGTRRAPGEGTCCGSNSERAGSHSGVLSRGTTRFHSRETEAQRGNLTCHRSHSNCPRPESVLLTSMLSWSWLWCQIDKKWVLGSCRCPPKTTKSTLVVKLGRLVPRSRENTYRGDACGVSASERSDRRVWAVVGRVWGGFKDLGVCSRVGAVGCRDNSGAWGLRCALHRGRDGARPELSPVGRHSP